MPAFDPRQARNDASTRSRPFILVECYEQPDFEKRRSRVHETGNSFPRGQPARLMLFGGFRRTAAQPQPVFQGCELVHQMLHVRRARQRLQDRHPLLSYARRRSCARAYFFSNSSEAEFIQYLCRVGFGPSGNTWPKCASHLLQTISFRVIP